MQNLNGHSTWIEHSEAQGVAIETIGRRFARTFPGVPFDRHATPQVGQFVVITGKKGGLSATKTDANNLQGNTADSGQRTTDTQKTEVADTEKQARTPDLERAKTDWYGFLFRFVCVLIVLGHAGLIAYDCFFLWGIPGSIAGGIAFLSVLACLLLSADHAKKEVSEQMVWFVFLVDAAAGFVHYPTFWKNAHIGYEMGIREFETGCLAAFVCLCSMAALYFFRASKIQNNGK